MSPLDYAGLAAFDADAAELPAVPTVKQAAAYLGVNEKTLYEAIDAGKFPARRIGRRIVISREALLNWLRKESVTPQPEGGR